MAVTMNGCIATCSHMQTVQLQSHTKRVIIGFQFFVVLDMMTVVVDSEYTICYIPPSHFVHLLVAAAHTTLAIRNPNLAIGWQVHLQESPWCFVITHVHVHSVPKELDSAMQMHVRESGKETGEAIVN